MTTLTQLAPWLAGALAWWLAVLLSREASATLLRAHLRGLGVAIVVVVGGIRIGPLAQEQASERAAENPLASRGQAALAALSEVAGVRRVEVAALGDGRRRATVHVTAREPIDAPADIVRGAGMAMRDVIDATPESAYYFDELLFVVYLPDGWEGQPWAMKARFRTAPLVRLVNGPLLPYQPYIDEVEALELSSRSRGGVYDWCVANADLARNFCALATS